jgi:hypothetical protein
VNAESKWDKGKILSGKGWGGKKKIKLPCDIRKYLLPGMSFKSPNEDVEPNNFFHSKRRRFK